MELLNSVQIMKSQAIRVLFTIIWCLLLTLPSCTKQLHCLNNAFEHTEESATKVCPMTFDGGLFNFNVNNIFPTKSTSSDWKDGDKVYVLFYNGTSQITGEASFSTTDGWSISYEGSLAKGVELKCEVRHFKNVTSSSAALITLSPSSEIYESTDGTYEYNGDIIAIKADLLPKTSRIRFIGSPKEEIYLTGISTYTTFSPEQHSFTSSKSMVYSSVEDSGSTPYIYGFNNEEVRQIGIIGSNYAYTRTLVNNVFKVGDSGYMTIPSFNAHNNWRSGLYITIGSVEFKMIPVSGHTSGFFLVGETEVTTSLYNTIIGSSIYNEKPIDNISYQAVLKTIKQLNQATELNFWLPTSSQWEYAAKGGNSSQNFIYSGSNNANDVAWYSENGGARQNVKTKAPNELGIYDMSGNVAEFVSTLVEDGNYGDLYPYVYGGSFRSSIDNIKPSSKFYTRYVEWKNEWSEVYYGWNTPYDSDNCKASGVGFRLILTCK